VVVAVAALVPLRMMSVFIALAGSGLDWKIQASELCCILHASHSKFN
jgi:hypothetical protein